MEGPFNNGALVLYKIGLRFSRIYNLATIKDKKDRFLGLNIKENAPSPLVTGTK